MMWIDIVIAIGTVGAAIFAGVGLRLANKTAKKQLELQELEWRPRLSYVDVKGNLRISHKTGQVFTKLELMLYNIGKCALRYEVMKFDVFINKILLGEVLLKSMGSVVCAGTGATFLKNMPPQLVYTAKPDLHNSPECKIDFLIKYHTTEGADTPKPEFRIECDIFPEFLPGKSEEIGDETYTVYNIGGWLYGEKTYAD